VIVRDVTEQVRARQEIEVQAAELAVLAQTADRARRDALTLAELTRRLGQAQTMDELTAQTFAVLAPALEVGWMALIQLQHARSHLLGLHGPVPGEVRARLAAGDGLRGQTLWRAVQQGPQYLEQTDQPLLAAQGVTGVALVPLPRKPQRGEVLLIAAREGLVLSWTARQRTLLEAAAEALCAAWERVALLEDLRRAAEYARALVDISQLIETDDAVDTVAARAGAIVARASGVDWLALVVAEGDHARVLTSHSGPRVSRAFTARVSGGMVRGEGILWQVLDRHEALYIDDYAAAPGANDSLIQHGVRAAAWVPLSRVGHQSLLLSAMRMDRQPWHDHDRALFEAAARSVNVALERQAHLRELETAALTDALTALGNRRAFEADLQEAVTASRRDGTPLTVVMIDLDGLKHFNDTHGHDRGGALLRAFAQALRQSFRNTDRIYRLGGDEYALLLDSTGTPEDFLRRVQQAVALTRASGFETAGASAGVAGFPVDGASAAALAKRADERLYAAKQARPGRGQPR
jgi:diguanylate cyclase (GGDEF)-like protein